jgi:hypothetical protein
MVAQDTTGDVLFPCDSIMAPRTIVQPLDPRLLTLSVQSTLTVSAGQ